MSIQSVFQPPDFPLVWSVRALCLQIYGHVDKMGTGLVWLQKRFISPSFVCLSVLILLYVFRFIHSKCNTQYMKLWSRLGPLSSTIIVPVRIKKKISTGGKVYFFFLFFRQKVFCASAARLFSFSCRWDNSKKFISASTNLCGWRFQTTVYSENI